MTEVRMTIGMYRIIFGFLLKLNLNLVYMNSYWSRSVEESAKDSADKNSAADSVGNF